MVAMIKTQEPMQSIPNELLIVPKPLSGTVSVPSSKSMSHRHLICAALAEGVSILNRLQDSEDVRATIRAVEALGARVKRMGEQVVVTGAGAALVADQEDSSNENAQNGINTKRSIDIHCGESGSTLRFLIPIAMLLAGEKVFEGEGRLPERPLSVYLENFEQLGIQYEYSGKLPLKTSDKLPSGHYKIRGNESSQYLSGLLMALPLLKEDSHIEIIGSLESRDYVALTLQAMEAHGVHVIALDDNHFHIPGDQRYKPLETEIEGDYSQAAFFIVAGLMSRGAHSHLKLRYLNPESMQADRRILDIVRAMGGTVSFSRGILTVKASETQGVVIDASQCPDIIPVLGILAAGSEGTTKVINGQRLRIKESDRIKTTVDLITQLGGNVLETEDGFEVHGKGSSLLSGLMARPLRGGAIDSHNDHRIAMTAAVASTACENPVVISGAGAVKKSYPHFYQDLTLLGGVAKESLIGKLRDNIDAIDAQMVALIEDRLRLIKAIGENKNTLGLPVFDPAREEKLLGKLRARVSENQNWPVVEAVYEQVLRTSREIQQKSQPKYAFFGAEGSYTHGALLKYLEGKVPQCALGHKTFHGVVDSVVKGRADIGLLPIENSTTGSITQVYDLIGRGDIEIVGEVTCAIEHYLLAPKGLELKHIQKVYSHPQALSQCKLYLNKQKWRRHEVSSSGQAASMVAKHPEKPHAAVGSLAAAKQYELDVIEGPLNDFGPNQTRFIVFARRGEQDLSHCDTVGVRLQMPHICGQLYHVLEVFYKHNLNLLKIESRPIGEKPFEYEFFIDFEADFGSEVLKNALTALESLTTDLQVMGGWRKN